MVQHLCLWHLSTDMQMSHNSFAERELILTRSLTMVQHLYLWHLSQARPNSEHPVRYPLNATQQASGSSIHYGATPCLWHLSTDMQMSHNSFAERELILTRSLTMVQHLYLWHLSQARPNSEHPVRYPLNATQQASGSSIHYGATPCLWHLSTDMQMSHNSFAEQG